MGWVQIPYAISLNTKIMAYGSTPYVGMIPKINGGHIKSAQMTRLKLYVRLVKGLYEPYQALPSASMSNETVNFAGEHC